MKQGSSGYIYHNGQMIAARNRGQKSSKIKLRACNL